MSKWFYAFMVLLIVSAVFGVYVIASAEVVSAAPGQYCTQPAALSARWCGTGMAVTSCKDGCAMYNNVNKCAGANWKANCEAGCTAAGGCNPLY